MDMNQKYAARIMMFGLLVLGGCVNLKPQPDRTRFYVLGSDQSVLISDGLPRSGLVIGMRRLSLAPYLDTPSIVVRRNANEISFSDLNRWGEDLETGISRALSQYLEMSAAISSVDMVPWPDQVEHDFVLSIQIHRFEGELPDGTRLLASWSIHNPDDGRVLKQGSTNQSTSGWIAEDYSDLVQKLDAVLQNLAIELADELGMLG